MVLYTYLILSPKFLWQILLQKQDVSAPVILSPAPPADKKPKLEKVRSRIFNITSHYTTCSIVLLLLCCICTYATYLYIYICIKCFYLAKLNVKPFTFLSHQEKKVSAEKPKQDPKVRRALFHDRVFGMGSVSETDIGDVCNSALK